MNKTKLVMFAESLALAIKECPEDSFDKMSKQSLDDVREVFDRNMRSAGMVGSTDHVFTYMMGMHFLTACRNIGLDPDEAAALILEMIKTLTTTSTPDKQTNQKSNLPN